MASNSIEPSKKFLNYPTNAVDVDLMAANQGGDICRAIRCHVAGTLVVVSEAGDTVSLPFNAGETQNVRCRKTITLGSTTALNITVYW